MFLLPRFGCPNHCRMTNLAFDSQFFHQVQKPVHRKRFQLANVPDGHAHRFRDTFATELLQAGVPIERVAILLGHQSVRVTAKYYSPWTESRQRQIESDLERAWARDPIVLLETKGTPQVHERN